MTVGTIAFFGISLFMIHEFEEIIRFRTWITRYKNHPSHQHDLIIRQASSYPSTPAIAAMILEEFLLSAIALALAILMHSYELALAYIIVNSIHLILHLAESVRARHWTPGSVTAVATGLVNAFLVYWIAITTSIHVGTLVLCMVAFGAVMTYNLLILHKSAHRVAGWLETHP